MIQSWDQKKNEIIMIKFAKDNLEVCIETEPIGDGVKFFITIPNREPSDIVTAFRLAGFKVDNYEVLRESKDVRFVCLVESYEDATKKYSIFVNSLNKSKFRVIKRRKKRYSRKEIFAMFD